MDVIVSKYYPILLGSLNTDPSACNFFRSFLTIFIKLLLILGERDDRPYEGSSFQGSPCPP